ncbi:MAG TPA: hypothetical protein PKA64_14055, partial [Myxococcota bacterium]|nr:hypothetical protein [Myxococcota bacterium]
MSETAEQRYRRGMDMLPAWDEEGPEADARYAEGVALVIEAADAGHEPAMRSLADGVAGEEAGLWCVRLAQAGEDNPLKSSLTNTDFPPEHGLAVLEAARRGEPWAMAAVGG